MGRFIGIAIVLIFIISIFFYIFSFVLGLVFIGAGLYGCFICIRTLVRYFKGEDISQKPIKETPADAGVLHGLNEAEPVLPEEPVKLSLVEWVEKVDMYIPKGSQSSKYLHNIKIYLNNLDHESIEENKKLLDGISHSFELYANLWEGIRTDNTEKILKKIEESFPKYEYALKTMYEKSISDEMLEADIHINILDQQLQMNGYSENDFERMSH